MPLRRHSSGLAPVDSASRNPARELSPAPTVLRTRVGGGVPNQAPSAVTSTAPSPPSVTKAAPTRAGTRPRATTATASGSGTPSSRVTEARSASSSSLGLMRSGAPRSTTARRAAPEVSTAIRGAFGAARTAAMTST